MSRGLFIGRFQPFHKGHLEALKWILGREDEVIVAVGSAQFSHSLKNPFTAGERIEMIWLVVKELNLEGRVIITCVPDTNSMHNLWVPLLKAWLPRFDRAYTNDPLSRRLLVEGGVEVHSIPFFNMETYSATHVRELMTKGEKWEHLVPSVVAEYIKKIGGDKRLREIYSTRQ